MIVLIAALRTHDFKLLSVIDGDVVTKGGVPSYVVATVQTKFHSLQGPLQNISQQLGAFILFLFLFCHMHLPKYKNPADQ